MATSLKLTNNNYWDLSDCYRKGVTTIHQLANSFTVIDCGWTPGNTSTSTSTLDGYPKADFGPVKGTGTNNSNCTGIDLLSNPIQSTTPFKRNPLCFSSLNVIDPPATVGGARYAMGCPQDGGRLKLLSDMTCQFGLRIHPYYGDTTVRHFGINWVALDEYKD